MAFEDFGRSGHATDWLLDSMAKLRTSQILGTNALLQTEEHPLFERTKRPLLEHWRRTLSFILVKQNVTCIMMGLNNASHDHRRQDAQLAAADPVHHADLNFEVSHRGL